MCSELEVKFATCRTLPAIHNPLQLMTTTRIALCSDTHFWPQSTQRFGQLGSQLQPWSTEIQATLLAELMTARPDLLLHLGDITCGGGSFGMSAATFYSTLESILAAFQKLPVDFYGLPGNHDCALGENWAFAEKLLGLGAGLGRTIDTPYARLVLLHTQGHSLDQIRAALPGDPTYGWVSSPELARLENALATAGSKPVLLFCHQLLHAWVGEPAWADLYGIQNADAVLALLAHYGNVRAVFQAHAHRLDVQRVMLGQHPCWFVIQPAVIEYPLGWLDLTVDADQVQVKMQRLPLVDLAETSRQCGNIEWRAGQPEWRNFIIPLT